MIAFVAVLVASEFVYIEERVREFDLNSGRFRVTKRHLWRCAEEIEETWISKALNASPPKSPPNWVVTHRNGKKLWWAKVHSTCTYRHVYSVTRYIEAYTELFTPKARKLLAIGFLSSVQRVEDGDPGSMYFIAFEREVKDAFVLQASKTPVGEDWVRAFHARHGL